VSRTDTATFADLRADGNGVAALRTTIRVGFTGQRASDALKTSRTRRSSTSRSIHSFPSCARRSRSARTSARRRPRCSKVARESRLRVRVSREGQVVVAALPALACDSAGDRARHDAAVTLPSVRTSAERVERQEFDSRPASEKCRSPDARPALAPVFVEPDVLRSVQMLPGHRGTQRLLGGLQCSRRRGRPESRPHRRIPDLQPVPPVWVVQHVHRSGGRPSERAHRRAAGAVRRRLSSVLSVESANATTSALRGTAEVSLVSSNASLGRTFHDGEGSWMIAARRTYADAV
jgi:hypothetical protein